MKSNTMWSRAIAVAFALLLVAGVASAQLQSGNLFVTVNDEKGAARPGSTITLSGNGGNQLGTSDANGAAKFLGLSPGSYGLRTELAGFSTVDYPNIVINVGRNTSIVVALSAAVEDVITVTFFNYRQSSRGMSGMC